MKKFLISSFFMMIFFSLYSQTRGVVLDNNNVPLKGVNVFFSDQNLLLFSNKDGEFKTELTIPTNSYINFYKQGYSSKIIKYSSSVELKIILNKLHITLDEVGVTESALKLGNSKLVNIEKKTLNFLTSNSILESITQLNGVDMISSGLGIQKIVIRGLSGMRVVTYLNGIQINNQQWANDHGIGFTNLGLNEVELIKGASALKYGSEAIGGLLYFKDSPFTSNNKLNGYVATKFNNSSYLSSSQFGVKWNKNNFYFNLYGQYSISSDYRLPNNKYLFNSRFKKNAIKFSLGHIKNKWQNIFRYQLNTEIPGIPAHIHGDPASVDLSSLLSSTPSFISRNDFKSNFDIVRPNQFVENQLFIYETNYFVNDLKLSLHTGHFINNLQEWEKQTRAAFDLDLSNTQISPSIRYTLNKITFHLGSQVKILNNKNNIDERLVPDASSNSIGSYFISDYEKDNYGVSLGVRYDYKNLKVNDQSRKFKLDFDKIFTSTSFSSGIYYKLLEHTFRFTYSGAYRTPHFSELFSNGVHHGTNRYEIGSEELGVEYANQFDFKYQWSNNHLAFILNPYAQYISDFISIEPTNSIISSKKVYNYIQYDQVEIKGIEMNLHYHPHQLHNLHLEQSYAILNSKNKDDNYGLALAPANSIKSKILFDLNNIDKLLFYKFDYISVYHEYKFKQEDTAQYEEATNSYSVISLQLGIKLNNKFNCVLGIDNLLNEEYTPHTSRVRGVAGGIPNPGRALNINLKYEF